MLEQSENHIDYRISQLKGKYDLTADDQKVEFLKEAAALVAALESPVEREVYGTKTAREAGLSPDAMAAEVKRLRGRAFRKAKQKEERQNLSPMLKNQPRARQLRYEDVPSGIAEEGVIRLLLKDAEAYSYVGDLRPEEFTSPCWGKVYRLISQRLARGEPCTAAALAAELTGEEMNLLAEIQEKPVSLANAAQAMEDYIQTIRSRHVKVDGDADLLAYGKRKRDNGGSEHE